MPRLRKETQLKRTQTAILELLTSQGVDTSQIELPTQTDEELLYEAQAVVNYFEARSNGDTKDWIYETCKVCGEQFVYAYHYNGIKSCSIECMADDLRHIGIKWHYGRSLRLRWGSAYPAIVPPNALKQINSILGE